MLLELLDEHRGAMEYDWRTRFGLPVSVIPESMSWAEGYRLATILVSDPSSQTGAAASGWQYPVGRDGLVLRDLYDLQHKSKSKRAPKSYPRPWDEPVKHVGSGSVSVDEWELLKAGFSRGTS